MGDDSEPQVGRAASEDIKGLLGMILDDFAGHLIDFTIDGHSVTRASVKSVAKAVSDGRISVYVWKSAGGHGGTYDTSNLARYESPENRFIVPKKVGMYTYDLVGHESVHAGFELALEKNLQKFTD